ncbi:MAG TPA: Fe-S cluster assembly protein SufD [Acetobacteraceae bacterium]|nr:Fe-S cluster assembly protein SufD [Acetobacteraceae bacterium]
MTAPVHTGVEGFLARYHGLRDRLPGNLSVRDAAAEAFRRAGLPGRRVEAWKYTDLRPVAAASFAEPLTPLAADSSWLARIPHLDAPRLVFVDGRYRPELSAPPVAAHFDSFASHSDFGPLAQPAREPLVALNTMLAEDGAELRVPDGMDAGALHLVSLATDSTGESTAFHPRHRIHLEPGARLTLLETSLGDGAYLHNPVTEVLVGKGATLTHVRLQDESSAAFHLATLYARIGAAGIYDSFVLNLGGRMVRTEVHAHLAGPNAIAHLNGAQLLAGTQHADFTSVVRHDAPNCNSRQTVKNVLAGRSRGVFQGRIEVARHAQKTDGFQMNQALLLSPDAEVDTKPELEIFADDVKCSHGATVGELDAEQLFYLRSRGVPDSEARSILVRAFLAEALQAVAPDDIRSILEDSVERWWQRQPA